MENKYFTPDIEDICVGYEYEQLINQVWTKEVFAKGSYLPENIDLLNWIHSCVLSKKIRVPYLTKEQIETEGWKENVLNDNEKALLLFLKNGYELRMYKNYICRFSILIVGAGIIPNWDKVLFEGKCKDINTFRKICKLLEIY